MSLLPFETIPDPMTDLSVRLPLARVRRDVRRSGLLPFTDLKATSLVSIVAGAPISGSWWGHPAGQLIYQVGEALDSDPDLEVVKLWRGKLTLIHRRLWPALLRIGRSRSEWQLSGIENGSLLLLHHVNRTGSIRSGRFPPPLLLETAAIRGIVRDLERRLLVFTRSVHTSTGAHALEAESWNAWNARVGGAPYSGSVLAAELAFENAARRLTPAVDPRKLFPWGRTRGQVLLPS